MMEFKQQVADYFVSLLQRRRDGLLDFLTSQIRRQNLPVGTNQQNLRDAVEVIGFKDRIAEGALQE